MNRSLAAIAASALVAASLPAVSFAQSASSESSSASSVSSVASSTSSVSSASSASSTSVSSSSSVSSYKRGEEWRRKCEDLTGLKLAQCIVKHNPGKGNKKDAVQRRNDDKILRLSAKCAEKTGMDKVACMRKLEKKAVKAEMRKDGKEMKRTIRGRLQD